MTLRRVSITALTDGSGDATLYTDPVSGFLDNVYMTYIDGATGADYTITEESTGRALLTITNAATSSVGWRPRVGGHPIANTGAGTIIPGGTTTAGDGNADLMNPVVGRIKVVVAQGGATLSNTLSFDIVR